MLCMSMQPWRAGYWEASELCARPTCQPLPPAPCPPAAEGRTAVHWAAHHGLSNALHTLLEGAAAADVDAEDAAG